MIRPRALLSFLPAAAGFVLIAGAAYADDTLPQFRSELFPSQLFWLAVTFAFLYVLMAFVALPSVRRAQDKRAAVIASELVAAGAANEQAKAMMAQYEKALADARAKAQATVREMTAAAAKQSAEKQAVQQKELGKRLAEAEAKITAVRDAAMRDVKGKADELAAAIVAKITGARG